MANCDYFEASHRDETAGAGEKNYREHVSSYKLSFGEIIVVVAAVVILAGMGMVNRDISPSSMTTSSISSSATPQSSALTRCDDDNHYLTDACEP